MLITYPNVPTVKRRNAKSTILRWMNSVVNVKTNYGGGRVMMMSMTVTMTLLVKIGMKLILTITILRPFFPCASAVWVGDANDVYEMLLYCL